jgi:tripartite-type tricarboxylate transporter receptor subunit TctC
MRLAFHALLGLTVLAAAGSAAGADTYPSRPIKVIVSYPAGGANDIVARSIGDEVSKEVGQPIVVENKSGAAGTVAEQRLGRFPTDTPGPAEWRIRLAPSLPRT